MGNCSSCATKIDIKRQESKGGNGICAACETHQTNEAAENGSAMPVKGASWEVHCLNKLKELVPHGYEMEDDRRNMLGSNKQTRTSNCDTVKQRRPDLLYVIREKETARIVCAINVEIDEDSHSSTNYASFCEVGKVTDTHVGLIGQARTETYRTGINTFLPIPDDVKSAEVNIVLYVFKLNPNSCDVKPIINLDRRIQVLADRINAIYARPTADFRAMIESGEARAPIVECLYYHSKHGKHHLDYFQDKAGNTGAWDWRGNCVEP